MSYNPDKLSFKVNEVSGGIDQPQIFLCNRQLNKIGEIYPVYDLKIKANLNGSDELSFSIPKEIKNYNNKDADRLNRESILPLQNKYSALYDKITDYSVILVEGFGYFETLSTIKDAYTHTKNIQGKSLGESELSQLYCTLECNTENDIARDDYVPSVLYNPENRNGSLIHRILSYAPNYKAGTVDETIKNIQRTFSFSNKDIISCFSEIAEELNCIFDVVVRRNDDGIVERVVNIYDAMYCRDCNSRNIINGICQDCNSTHTAGIGEDTTIQISTKNLSDEITLTPDGNMKNCFIIEGGDDIITSTVQGIMPSGNNKIYKFSDETRRSFSPELKTAYEEYEKQYDENKKSYEETLELEYGISDLILYLQSGRMPTVETSKRNLRDETIHLICQFQNLFPNGLGTLDLTDTTSRNGTVRQVFSLFVDDGYAVKQENGSMNQENGRLYWTGDIVVYEIGNNDSKATIHIGKNSSYIEWLDKTTSNGVLSSSDGAETTDSLSAWGINFTTDHGQYITYLKQKISITQKNYQYMEDQTFNNPKEWQKYSLNRLYSYYTGYGACIEVLYETSQETKLTGIENTAKTMIASYQAEQNKISEYMSRLEEMIYYLYHYYDRDFNADSPSLPSGQDIDYSKYNDPENRKYFPDALTAFRNMFHYIKWGTWAGGDESKSTDTPMCCGDCGSSYVTLLNCLNKGCNSTNIVTYSALAGQIRDAYQENPESLEDRRKEIRKKCDIKSDVNLGSRLYSELCSFLREDVYNNSNFTSDGLASNSQLISKSRELIRKAGQELAKACVSQHTLSGNIYAFAAYSRLNEGDFPIQNAYDKFKLGNFMRYFPSDNEEYKLRLSSEEFSWTDSGAELNVEFTDVIKYSNGNTSDLASLMQTMGSLATSFDSVKRQAEQGVAANDTFQKIKDKGLYSALSNALNARDIDVQMDDHGITLRKFDYELDDYSPYQMKLINRNIVMTDDNWKTAKMAVGLGRYGEGNESKLVYGVWADLLVGDLIVGKELVIKNEDDSGDSSVVIDKDGITIKNGSISWEKVNAPEISDIDNLSAQLSSITAESQQNAAKLVKELDQKVAGYLTGGAHSSIGENYMISPYIGGGYLNITDAESQSQVVLDPSNISKTGYIFQVKKQDDIVVGIDTSGNAVFNGEIKTTKGSIGGWTINENGIFHSNNKSNGGLDNSFKIDSSNSGIVAQKMVKQVKPDEDIFHDNKLSILPGVLKYEYKRVVEDKIEYTSILSLQNDKLIIKDCQGANLDSPLANQTCLYGSGIYIKRGKADSDSYFYDTRLTYHGLQIKGKLLHKLYSVVCTGENDIPEGDTREDPWIQQKADFGNIAYREEPMVNVMFYDSEPESENIVFDSYEMKNGEYVGFYYSIRNKTPGFGYHTKWWAVGNVAP